jgi:hypothetical protein
MVLNFAAGRKDPRYSLKSISAFLEQLKTESKVVDAIDAAEHSADFRSTFVDHPQQHKLYVDDLQL